MNLIERWVVLFCLVFLLASCSTFPTHEILYTGDGGIASINNSCMPPCYMGIIPGQTTKEGITKIFEGKKIQICTTQKNEIVENPIGNDCSDGVTISYSGNIVSEIAIIPSHAIYISDVIKINGDPSWVSIIVDGRPNEDHYTNAILLYDKIKATLYFSTVDGFSYQLLPNTKIKFIVYSDQSTYQTFFEKQFRLNWVGYGEYNN